MLTKNNLDELEQLAKTANLPWHIYKECQLDDQHAEIRDANHHYIKNLNNERDRYILNACNTTPELIIKNQDLQKQVQELEKALIKLVKIEVRLPECAVCWERDQCTDRSHGDNCLAIGYIVDTAKEAAKEDK